MAAHLAGVVAAHTTLPVVGVPLSGGALNGVDALYATVQMPRGIPVATVAIDGAANAAMLAVEILAVSDAALEKRLAGYREQGILRRLRAAPEQGTNVGVAREEDLVEALGEERLALGEHGEAAPE